MIRRTPLQRGTRGLRPVSAKRARLNKIYSALRKKFLEEHPLCQHWLAENGWEQSEQFGVVVFSNNTHGFGVPYTPHAMVLHFAAPMSCDIHHRRGRGKYLLDVSTWMAVSREGHDAIHRDPKTSYEKGYMLPR